MADADIDPGTLRGLDRFGAVLALTSLNVALALLVDRSGEDSDLASTAFGAILTLSTGVTLLLALRASGVTGRLRRVVLLLTGLGLASVLGFLVAEALLSDVDGGPNVGPPSLMWGLVTLATTGAVLRRLLQHSEIRVATLLAAISAYLLLALAYAFAYTAIDHYGSTPLFGAEEPTTAHAYFSFVTISTLGFGDLSPATELGRLAAVSEAVIGQVYLVTVVAMVVGHLGQRRVGAADSDRPAPTDR